ncbi:HAD hydrolase-like protein [Photobacterium sanguinicancri]|uniref:HAD hydrolase-like protein n=1 Tax=Photobacterium sanguinicancri TaxID=875932 RepID=UPI0026E3E1AC|nr:HAD hydrolase-like protein [Photobacterium sanguinicancri]MDO6497334.1 HAD hydrolase-like protein [Photobacterium sanguinicancri]
MKQKKIDAVIFDLDDTLISTSKLKEYREHRDYEGLEANLHLSKLYLPVKNLLHEIVTRHIPLALVTNSPRWYVDKLLKHHDIDCFDVVICYDDVGSLGVKPSEKGICLAIDQLGLSRKNAIIYIGDLDSDIIAAYAAGIKPIAPSWATRHPIDQVPAAIINSESLISCLDHYEEIALIADRTALNKAYNFPKKQLNFVPLNESGQVVPLKKDEIRLIALGRYFSQGSPLTASLHESHQLSKDIFAKEHSETYIIPQYYVDLVARVVETLPQYIFEDTNAYFDIVTVIPAKKQKNRRLENLLRRVEDLASTKSTFIPDLFEFSADAVSLKTLGNKASRLEELRGSFSIKSKYIKGLKGKTVLVIDDVITTGATFLSAFELLKSAQAGISIGICLAKTVSVKNDYKFCPECSRIMKIRTNKNSGIHFYGCSGYFEMSNRCDYSEAIKIKDCPLCGKNVVKKSTRRGSHFLSCVSYGSSEACGYTENVDEL